MYDCLGVRVTGGLLIGIFVAWFSLVSFPSFIGSPIRFDCWQNKEETTQFALEKDEEEERQNLIRPRNSSMVASANYW